MHGVGGAEKALARATAGARSERGREQFAPEHKARWELWCLCGGARLPEVASHRHVVHVGFYQRHRPIGDVHVGDEDGGVHLQ